MNDGPSVVPADGKPGESPAPVRLTTFAAAKGVAAGVERLPMLDIVTERLAKTLQGSLRRLAGDGVTVAVDPPAGMRLGDFLQKLPAPAMLCITRFDGSNAPGLVVAGPDLVYSAVELMLGGRPLPQEARPQRPFSAVERALAERMVRMVLADLTAAFQPIADVKLRMERIESSAKFGAIVRESSVVLVIGVHMQIDGRGGRVDLVFPAASIEPLREQLRQSYPGDKLGRDMLWEQHLTQELLLSHVHMSAVLDEPLIGLGDVMRWKVGSTLPLGATPTSPVKVLCGKSPVFVGSMGRHDDKVVVRIDGRVEG
ncbi:MAG TPA: FliM/FliN family flagellar motor switch protein [Methylomirabilota bacterium]|nr:FliM/FliN family flagellar motor switch protein [Methylomirabilota bacterium]